MNVCPPTSPRQKTIPTEIFNNNHSCKFSYFISASTLTQSTHFHTSFYSFDSHLPVFTSSLSFPLGPLSCIWSFGVLLISAFKLTGSPSIVLLVSPLSVFSMSSHSIPLSVLPSRSFFSSWLPPDDDGTLYLGGWGAIEMGILYEMELEGSFLDLGGGNLVSGSWEWDSTRSEQNCRLQCLQNTEGN